MNRSTCYTLLAALLMGPALLAQSVTIAPSNESANPLDVTGRGSLIPSTAVDQYAATLAQWFGVAQGNLTSVLPNVNNFAVQNLGFLG